MLPLRLGDSSLMGFFSSLSFPSSLFVGSVYSLNDPNSGT